MSEHHASFQTPINFKYKLFFYKSITIFWSMPMEFDSWLNFLSLLVLMNLIHLHQANWLPTFKVHPIHYASPYDVSNFCPISTIITPSVLSSWIGGDEVPTITPSINPERKKRKKEWNIHSNFQRWMGYHVFLA